MMRMVVYLAIVALCWQFEMTSSRTSTLWKLNTDSGKITGHISDTRGKADNIMLEEFSIPLFDANADVYAQDEVFYIIASTLALGASTGASSGNTDVDRNEGNSAGYGWVRESPENSIETMTTLSKRCNESDAEKQETGGDEVENKKSSSITGSSGIPTVTNVDTALVADESLNCKPVNFTYYDYLIGVGQRFNHPKIPEPEVT